jgi:predicted RNase H-like nuclease (RuvC/YqgF family)
MNLQTQINNIRMASKSQLVGEIRSKDQKIQSLDRVNKAMNEMINKITVAKKNLEKEVIRLQAENAELKKKRWFEFWR